MEEPSKAGPNDSEKNMALIQQFIKLEKEWESLKESNYKTRNPRRCSTGSASTLTSFDRSLVENSPRGLMSSLQHRRSPSDGILNARNWDIAVEEILRDRRSAIVSGRVKGRRLFGGSEVELDLNYDDSWSDLNPGPESVISGKWDPESGEDDKFADSSPVSCSFSEKVVVEVADVVEKRCGGKEVRGRKGGGGGGRCRVVMAWFAFVMILLTLGLIVIGCNGDAHEKEVCLVPT